MYASSRLERKAGGRSGCERAGKGGSEEEEAEMARMRWGIRRWKKGGGEV